MQSEAEQPTFAVQKSSWRGRYSRVLRVLPSRRTIVTLDPASWAATNEWGASSIVAVRVGLDSDADFAIKFGKATAKRRGSEAMASALGAMAKGVGIGKSEGSGAGTGKAGELKLRAPNARARAHLLGAIQRLRVEAAMGEPPAATVMRGRACSVSTDVLGEVRAIYGGSELAWSFDARRVGMSAARARVHAHARAMAVDTRPASDQHGGSKGQAPHVAPSSSSAGAARAPAPPLPPAHHPRCVLKLVADGVLQLRVGESGLGAGPGAEPPVAKYPFESLAEVRTVVSPRYAVAAGLSPDDVRRVLVLVERARGVGSQDGRDPAITGSAAAGVGRARIFILDRARDMGPDGGAAPPSPEMVAHTVTQWAYRVGAPVRVERSPWEGGAEMAGLLLATRVVPARVGADGGGGGGGASIRWASAAAAANASARAVAASADGALDSEALPGTAEADGSNAAVSTFEVYKIGPRHPRTGARRRIVLSRVGVRELSASGTGGNGTQAEFDFEEGVDTEEGGDTFGTEEDDDGSGDEREEEGEEEDEEEDEGGEGGEEKEGKGGVVDEQDQEDKEDGRGAEREDAGGRVALPTMTRTRFVRNALRWG
eukprot:g985.t1